MPHDVSISKDRKFILIKVVGTMDSPYTLQTGVDASALGRKVKIKRFLFDLTESRYVDSILSTHQRAYSDMRDPRLIPDARVALWVAQDDHSHDFAETVYQNAGYNLRVFRDYNSAISFLMEH